jgi:hypothetical protein
LSINQDIPRKENVILFLPGGNDGKNGSEQRSHFRKAPNIPEKAPYIVTGTPYITVRPSVISGEQMSPRIPWMMGGTEKSGKFPGF